MSPEVVAGGAGMAVFALITGFMRLLTGKQEDRAVARLGGLVTRSLPKERKPWLAGVAPRISRSRWGRALQGYARKAHPTTAFSDVLAWGGVGLTAGSLLGYLLFGTGPLVLACAIAGPLVLDRAAIRMGGRRLVRLEGQLPDALYLQAASLRAGHSTVRSLAVMAEQVPAPLGLDISAAVRAMRLGVPVEDALRDLADRTGSRDVDLWVTAMLVHRTTGGNLTSLIESLASQVKQRASMRAEIRALTAQGRLSGMVVAAAPVAFFFLLSVTAREQMEVLYSTPMGLMLLATGISLEAAGFIWIRRILRIKA